jgi:hypothetical protein
VVVDDFFYFLVLVFFTVRARSQKSSHSSCCLELAVRRSLPPPSVDVVHGACTWTLSHLRAQDFYSIVLEEHYHIE